MKCLCFVSEMSTCGLVRVRLVLVWSCVPTLGLHLAVVSGLQTKTGLYVFILFIFTAATSLRKKGTFLDFGKVLQRLNLRGLKMHNTKSNN